MIGTIFLLGILGIFALMLTACSGLTGSEDEVVIGGLAPLSGDAVGLGLPIQQAAELAVSQVNADWADAGMSFDIVWEDGMCTGTAASTAAQKLINVDGFEVVLGGLCSSETLAAAPIAEAAGTLLFSAACSMASLIALVIWGTT